MEVNLLNGTKKEQVKISQPTFITNSSFMQSYSYNKSYDKLDLFKYKLKTQNYFEEDNDINVIYPSTK